MARPHPARRRAGFTMIEMLVVLAVLGIALTLGIPALRNFINRGKLEGISRETAALMQIARFESIKKNVATRVVADFDAGAVYAFADMDPADGKLYNAAVDKELGRYTLPTGVSFWAGEDASPKGANAIKDLSCNGSCAAGGWEEFRPDGSVENPGGSLSTHPSIRFGDERGNFIEVRVATAATGRIELGKWDPNQSKYYPPGDNGQVWQWY